MRQITPEILDQLPSDHPDAVASRRDLRLINAVMGNHRWLAKRMLTYLNPGDQIVELGAGDGQLAGVFLKLAPPNHDFRYQALDLAPQPQAWPDDPRFHWLTGDLFQCDALASATMVVANLILHHFTDPALATLGAKMSQARVVLAREPARRRRWMSYLLYPLGLNRVTKHDMKASIEAGFLGDELADALGLRSPDWSIRCSETLFNAHQMQATSS